MKDIIQQTLLSSVNPKSLPCAAANRFPCTKFPTITDAGPTEVSAEVEAEVEVPQSCNNEPLFFYLTAFFDHFDFSQSNGNYGMWIVLLLDF